MPVIPPEVISDLRTYAAANPLQGVNLLDIMRAASPQADYDNIDNGMYEIVAMMIVNNLDFASPPLSVFDFENDDGEIICTNETFLRALDASCRDHEYTAWEVRDGRLYSLDEEMFAEDD